MLIAKDIDWDIDHDEACYAVMDMDDEDAMRVLKVSRNRYYGMDGADIGDRIDYLSAMHSLDVDAILKELCLPDRVCIPDDIAKLSDDEIGEWLEEEYAHTFYDLAWEETLDAQCA